MLCYDFLIFFGIRKVTSQPYSRFPGNRSTLRVCFSLDTTSCMVRFGRPFTVIVQDSASSEMRESTWDVSISLILVPFQACHRLHLLLMLTYQRNQHRPPNNLFRKAHGCSSNPAGLQYSYATRNTCPIHLYYN